jgi:hypothetical protein
MQRVVEILKAQHHDIEESIESVEQMAAFGRREDCLCVFEALATRIARQLAAEEELLRPLYGPEAGDRANPLLEDHQQLGRLVTACRRRLEAGDLVQFADDAQTLMLKFALHAGCEERAVAATESGGAAHESAVGLYVERMAPKR